MAKPKVRVHIKKALKNKGPIVLGRMLGITYQAIYGWRDRNKMPDKEFAGGSVYSARIQHATDNDVTVEDLLGWVPEPQAKELERLKRSGT